MKKRILISGVGGVVFGVLSLLPQVLGQTEKPMTLFVVNLPPNIDHFVDRTLEGDQSLLGGFCFPGQDCVLAVRMTADVCGTADDHYQGQTEGELLPAAQDPRFDGVEHHVPPFSCCMFSRWPNVFIHPMKMPRAV